ncbi:conserved hypothetical protein [Histoplasma mississippiense (nom. inval.)]|uniref:conserved hypothetical protein n=1 Tax=Ajellomyces capsulatus (strain NAm1 / WU24) TaxID=2059318 RepID=UPI000157BB77|nr:conserved hypothetical protein [Histoplasma mississippiense (nom. inval.)]EDN04204.1 conserved hypothetical protein [Histoplasma mississippiense (nom. inval.)]
MVKNYSNAATGHGGSSPPTVIIDIGTVVQQWWQDESIYRKSEAMVRHLEEAILSLERRKSLKPTHYDYTDYERGKNLLFDTLKPRVFDNLASRKTFLRRKLKKFKQQILKLTGLSFCQARPRLNIRGEAFNS